MPTLNVYLSDDLNGFINAGIEAGRYGDAGDAVREGLRLLEQQGVEEQAKLEWLRAAVQEGINAADRGDYVTLNSDEEITEHFRSLREQSEVVRS